MTNIFVILGTIVERIRQSLWRHALLPPVGLGSTGKESRSMFRFSASTPTEVELQILNILWRHFACTVRQVHNALLKQRDTGYSTTLKMMQVMTEKGLLIEDATQRLQVYRSALSEEQTQMHIVDDLIQRAFRGAVDQLVLRAVRSKHLPKEDLSRIKQLLRQMERESK